MHISSSQRPIGKKFIPTEVTITFTLDNVRDLEHLTFDIERLLMPEHSTYSNTRSLLIEIKSVLDVHGHHINI